MRIAVVGTGYVGLVTGTCLAETGNDVTCVDCDRTKVDQLNHGKIPIYEPGLSELVKRNAAAGRLHFTTDLADVASSVTVIFLAVGTPPADDGSVDLSALWVVVDQIAPHLGPQTVVVLKSTVPVGTNAAVTARLKELTGRTCDVASNPEFLKEGTAIDDFMKPDRVVVGTRREEVGELLWDLYQPYLRTDKPLLAMSPESAEMTKYASNSLLSTKISFINEVANLCERTGADINEVRRGMGHDSRIGFAFLFPGVGYGGSCFPKDVCGLASVARQHGLEPLVLDAVDQVNRRQKAVLAKKIERHFEGKLADKTIAVWGLAFKPGTDDIREAPALTLIDQLLERGATLRVHDPEAMPNVRAIYGDKLIYCDQRDDALEGADALAILTEWKHFVQPDFDRMRGLLRRQVIFDGRNIYDPHRMKDMGFTYYSIGRPPIGVPAIATSEI
ncbi:MAG TPA: UDP-glucose/GDP-mannose dehydrogenase family protein [Thermoguttaceae bacterium]|nr:UDP-glucose/GDP-mannose dehydrogenase family protein [Thermoguttaceae bacterium]